MLTLLTLDQVSAYWDVIKYAVEESLPPIAGEHPDKMNRILSSLLAGRAQCWASYTRSEKESRFEGIVVTRVLYDDVSNTKSLLIYCLYGYESVDKASWSKGFNAIIKYAKSRDCTYVTAYTDNSHIVKIVNQLGGEAKYTFILFNVNDSVQKLNELNEV